MNEGLIAYFSRPGENYFGGMYRNIETGNTELVARMIAEETGADMFRIDPVIPYSESYIECTEQARKDQENDTRPEIKNPPADLDRYDTIYLGFPNYWGTMPMHVFTFLEMYDMSGKTIRPFCTHEGSGMGRSESDIRRICPGSTVTKGLAINGSRVSESRESIRRWLKS